MSTWRRKAIDCLPELRNEFEDKEISIYTVFTELLPATVEAHKTNNTEQLKKCYDFAEWCFRQKEKDLWNAAGVSFYEHLGDYEETLHAMPRWIKPDIYIDVRVLLELRLSEKELQKLDGRYAFH
ncbi:hypothetical protein BH10BAC2_BH10BAC2_21690 [soil metagenome]